MLEFLIDFLQQCKLNEIYNLTKLFITVFYSYLWTRFPVRPIYGGFPVKFITHLGDPIYPEEGMTAKDLQEKTAAAIEKLIVEKQRIPGSIVGGLLDRFFEKTKIDVIVNKTRQRRFVSLSSRDS
jgi:hypothetical protein